MFVAYDIQFGQRETQTLLRSASQYGMLTVNRRIQCRSASERVTIRNVNRNRRIQCRSSAVNKSIKRY